ncbi:hypothetical protein [Tunturiibacter gelidiferens]|uniref:hypothetical protein n=1 Tax=Tunturiibacter gelidiferens TaxID=3069689 RepID=UPI003D9B449B
MKPTIEAMLPKSETEESRTSESYSEGGLSGEAALDVKLDTEPFMLRQHTDEEVADYDKGFECGQSGGQNDDTKSQAWQRGWAEARE